VEISQKTKNIDNCVLLQTGIVLSEIFVENKHNGYNEIFCYINIMNKIFTSKVEDKDL
jgi:hypothetical protein